MLCTVGSHRTPHSHRFLSHHSLTPELHQQSTYNRPTALPSHSPPHLQILPQHPRRPSEGVAPPRHPLSTKEEDDQPRTTTEPSWISPPELRGFEPPSPVGGETIGLANGQSCR